MCISDASSEGPSAIEALTIKTWSTQDSGTKGGEEQVRGRKRDGEPGEQEAKEIPVHMPTMSHEDETPDVQLSFTQNSNEALLRRSLFR